MRVQIVGGFGGIGRWFAEHVFGPSDMVLCYDRSKPALSTLPKTITKCQIDTDSTDTYTAYEKQFQPEDWILLAVPEPALEASVRALGHVVKPGSLFVVLTSVQTEPLKIVRANVPGTCAVLGAHPLFGHTIASPVGQIVALTDFDRNNLHHRMFRHALRACGLLPTELSPEDHDRYMAVVQALTHFCLLGFAACLANHGYKPAELLKLRTPNFQFLYAFASRVLKLSPTTTGSIQATSDARAVREVFLETLAVLHRDLSEAGDTAGCARLIEELSKPLTGAEVAEGAEVASAAVDNLQQFELLLHRYQNSGSPFVFRHRTTGRVHIVRIIEVQENDILFEESTREEKRGSTSLYAIGLDERARENYRRIGLPLPPLRREEIKKRNVKLLISEEFESVQRSLILPMTTDATFGNPHGYNEKYFEQILPLLVKDLWRCQFLDRYQRPDEAERVTVKLTFSPAADRELLIADVRTVIEQRN